MSRRARDPLAGIVLAAIAITTACGAPSEEAFTRGRSLQPCLQRIPACPGLFAACELDSTTYAQQRFPDASPFRFLVYALPGETLRIDFFFVTQSDAGLDTQILWYEPGCSDVYSYESDGADLFAEGGDENIISRKETVLEGGDHLIEIFSDFRSVVDLAVSVEIPER